ncbi:MAG: DUF2959 domain-containing protein, partial [Planctomycetes bacterium]|nr:DUF2959 domain-containing protein [Planctomycetota bacterium]
SQKETREQFASALEQFSSVVKVEGEELERVYKKLSSELEASEDKAAEVHKRIVSVEKVSKDLFAEWEEELAQYNSDTLRENSRRTMEQTKARYEQLITRMKAAESRIDPVLNSFRDQVLFLKHNLNAKAIASIRNEIASVETDVAKLLEDMDVSIREAEDFIKEMNEDAE